jgi:hypothetical protein
LTLSIWLAWLTAVPALAGSYRQSAHGSSSFGVDRSAIDGRYAEYSAGNCAHCHEMHASLGGVEPEPSGTGASHHALFADSFNSNRTQNLYQATDDFCFYCHSDNPGPQVKNQDYSATFGGATAGSGPQTIMEAFNQASYHNLFDIWNFLSNDPTYSTSFSKLGNPCSTCHNSHLARRNWDSSQPGFPLLSAISKPGDHFNLWGETALMSAYVSYEAPFSFGTNREPAGVGDQDGGKTPDYVALCTACHDPVKIISSTALNRQLKLINWGSTGLNQDKHGPLVRGSASSLREPYATAATLKTNFVLSCLDCHESHGSENIMLLRRRINGENLEGTITSTDAMSYVCKRCHKDDLAASAGTGQADRWEYVHHLATDAPYAESTCTDCHASSDGSLPVACGNCHGHGMDDSWAGANKTGRNTF